MINEKSEQIYKEAVEYIPGGVNSPVRAFKSVGLSPIFVDHAHGSKIYDVDGNECMIDTEDLDRVKEFYWRKHYKVIL